MTAVKSDFVLKGWSSEGTIQVAFSTRLFLVSKQDHQAWQFPWAWGFGEKGL